MNGYIENLELINVSDILQDVSINDSSSNTMCDRSINRNDISRMVNVNLEKEISAACQRFNLKTDIKSEDAQITQEHENTEKLNAQDILPEIPNPVGYLQEMCVKKRLSPPVYDILGQYGPSHNPTFSTSCRVGEFYKVVSTNKKKTGKDMAAREIILAIRKSLEIDSTNGTDSYLNRTENVHTTETVPEKREVTNATFSRTINYVGCLQEICVRKQLPPPSYGTEKSTGTPNNPSFYIFCEVGPHREVGIGPNKKCAKHSAAEKVLAWLEIPNNGKECDKKENTQADNNEILHQTIMNGENIELLSDTTLDNFFKVPNPVGHLQELCVKNHLSPPVYGILRMEGPPHCPIFTTFCKVDNFYQIASSSNKKCGKEMVSWKILKCLTECKPDLN